MNSWYLIATTTNSQFFGSLVQIQGFHILVIILLAGLNLVIHLLLLVYPRYIAHLCGFLLTLFFISALVPNFQNPTKVKQLFYNTHFISLRFEWLKFRLFRDAHMQAYLNNGFTKYRLRYRDKLNEHYLTIIVTFTSENFSAKLK